MRPSVDKSFSFAGIWPNSRIEPAWPLFDPLHELSDARKAVVEIWNANDWKHFHAWSKSNVRECELVAAKPLAAI